MSFVNLPPALQAIFSDLVKRIQKLENVNRFYATVYPIINTDSIVVSGLITGDITDPKIGQIWLNTTTNQLRIVTSVLDSGTGLPSTTSGVATTVALVAPTAPATATSTGIAGQIAYDATHIYVCIATNTWVRATLATW
jgi:hypothetical protein